MEPEGNIREHPPSAQTSFPTSILSPMFFHPHGAQGSRCSGCHSSPTLGHLGPGDDAVGWSWPEQTWTEEPGDWDSSANPLLGLTQEGPHLWRERVAPADYKEKLKV